MEIEIDVNSSTPIFSQLVAQVKELVRAKVITSGFALPSIRQLANELSVNQNTIAKAYKHLERDLIIVARGYRGSFIHEDAYKNCHINIQDKGVIVLRDAIKTLQALGLTDSEIRITFTSLMKQSK